MFFKIKNKRMYSTGALKCDARRKANVRLALYTFGATEIRLDKLIRSLYKIDLRSACLLLIFKATFATNSKKELFIYFKDPYYDRLARIITYGTGRVKGSDILQYMFH